MKNLHFANTKIKDGFWKYYADLVRSSTVYAVYDRFKETGRFEGFKCDWREGEPFEPHIFYDSDVAKWIEGVGYLSHIKREPELEKIVDETVSCIAKNQLANGYFNSSFISKNPSKIFRTRNDHELYCTGHLIEAAIAYHEGTGKRELLDCMLKNVDYIYKVFIEEQSAGFVTPGHEEIELALLKLYDYLGNEKHLELARFFIDKRGNNEREEPWRQVQADIPVRAITEAVGHAVRAGYLYAAMAKLSGIDKDSALKSACDRVFENITTRRMSITGGIGANHSGEAFSYDYDLPNRDTYNETCAAIALALFAGEMQQLEPNSAYGDIIERIYYNGFLSGVSLDGKKFFYTNPLEIDQKKYNRSGAYQPQFERVEVFDCSCCPPNVVRILASVPRYMYTVAENGIYCNQFINSETELTVSGKPAKIVQETAYPTNGEIRFAYFGEPTTLFVRIPDWCVEYAGETENGFAKFSVKNGESVEISLPMNIHFIEANPNINEDAGRYAVTRGPVVYCMEGIDNGENLRDITLLEKGEMSVKSGNGIPAPVIYISAERRLPTDALYSLKNDRRQAFTARLIPYFSFSNRESTDLLVWTMVK